MKFILSVLFISVLFGAIAQTVDTKIKIIPEISLKFGSQKPAVGGQFNLTTGILFNDKYFAGIGGGLTSDMGMGGKTFPLYLDGRYYFSLPNNFLFRLQDQKNNFQVDAQMGIDINNNTPFETGFIAGIGFAYLFDFIKIKEFTFPSFYLGLNIEYNVTKFYDEYRGYTLLGGKLVHTMLNIKIAFDINPIPVKISKNKN